MASVGLVAILALLEYSVLGFLVGRARGMYKVPAPATTGDPVFERYFRVHQNTMEQLVVFLPAMLAFGYFVSTTVAALLGVVFVIARAIYAAGYISKPESRETGAVLTFVVNAILMLGGLIGALRALL